MKTPLFKPGFEFIFSLSLIVILGLPPMLRAQTQKDTEIKIVNGDTTVNGKNIKELSAADRKIALRDISHLDADGTVNGNGDNNSHVFMYKRRDTSGVFEFRNRKHENDNPAITENIVIRDSLGNIVEAKSGRHMKRFAFKYRNDNDEAPDRMELMGRNPDRLRGGPMMRVERRNSQNFEYTSTDNEGVLTHISFRVSEASNADLKRMPHVEGAKLQISDLNLVPEFTSGKTLLMFNLPGKSAFDVKVSDSEGKILFNERSTGSSFSKSFILGLNGVYYLQVKQGNSVAVKRIMKEE